MKTHIIAFTIALAGMVSCGKTVNGLEYVDTEIGGVSVLLQPTRPTVQIPNQVIRWSPGRADLLDDMISDYPLTLVSHRQQSVFGFLPLVEGRYDGDVRIARQVYDDETTTPYSYKCRLEGCSIRFSPSRKSGIAEITFDDDVTGGRILRFRGLNGHAEYGMLSDRALGGTELFMGMAAYAYIEFDSPVTCIEGDGSGLMLLGTDASVLRMRYGISYISMDQARENLGREIPDFNIDKVCGDAREVWERTLGRIEVSGGTEAQKRLFYSSFYRCCERMVDISEYGRYYSAFDHSVHESGRPFYNDNWMWDTHISLEPLQTILNPAMEEDKIQSYVEMYKQGGTMPSFAVIWGDWPAMTGNYAAVWMADARAKGLEFDLETGYQGIRKNSLDATLIPWRNGGRTEIDDFYNENGYFPALHPGEEETVSLVEPRWERRQAVSITTAFSYADWATAKLAKELGYEEDEALFRKRAAFYKNVYRPEKGLFWPKDKDGQWVEGVDPRYAGRHYYTENNAYTFQWDVKHDLDGLFGLMGGRAEAEKKLDDLFRIQNDIPKYMFLYKLPDATGMVGQFAMGNEPSFHIPYLYDYLGAPWKTQKRIHQLIDRLFSDTVSGIPGDEDGGGMCSFVVFSMMGFFPVTPGLPVYAIGSPFFDSATINLPDGKKFTVKAKGLSSENKYIQSAKLNGKPLERAWFTHEELTSGGVLEFVMGTEPNKSWGADESLLPPSNLNL